MIGPARVPAWLWVVLLLCWLWRRLVRMVLLRLLVGTRRALREVKDALDALEGKTADDARHRTMLPRPTSVPPMPATRTRRLLEKHGQDESAGA